MPSALFLGQRLRAGNNHSVSGPGISALLLFGLSLFFIIEEQDPSFSDLLIENRSCISFLAVHITVNFSA